MVKVQFGGIVLKLFNTKDGRKFSIRGGKEKVRPATKERAAAIIQRHLGIPNDEAYELCWGPYVHHGS